MRSFLKGSRLWILGVVVVICLLVALAAGFILWRLDTAVQDYSLASKVPAERTLLYIRTSDRGVIEKTVKLFGDTERDLPMSIPTLEGIYEFAILQSGTSSDTILWVREHIGSAKVFSETGSASKELFLPEDQSHLSLAEARNFLDLVKHDTTNIAWIDPDLLRMNGVSSAPLLSSFFSETEHLLINFGATPRKLYFLGPRFRVTQGTSFPLRSSLSGTLLDITLGSPKNTLVEIGASLKEEDTALFEGIKGILQAALQNRSGRADIETVADELLSTPTRLMLLERDGKQSFLLMGTAKNKTVLEDSVRRIAALSSEGMVRHQTFFDENERTDVLLNPEKKEQDAETVNGWGVVGGKDLAIAHQEKKFVIGNDRAVLESELSSGSPDSSLGVPGTLSLPWLRSTIGDSLPFIGSLPVWFTEFVIPESRESLHWTAFPYSNGVEIEWMLR